MKSSFSYNIDNKVFETRLEFINYCNNQPNSQNTFDSADFCYNNLPDYIDTKEKIDPLKATAEWIKHLKQNNKKIVLMFGGGLDSTFALDCMIKSNCPPDYLLVYTENPFDNNKFFCSLDMEPRYALKYAQEIIDKNPILQKTKIWHIHMDKKYAEDFFSTNNWLKIISFRHSVETLSQHRQLPKISDADQKKYIFIQGGNLPKVKFINGKLFFYIMDLQQGSVIDSHIKKTYDFILDNQKMFKYFCNQYFNFFKNNINDPSKKKDLEWMFEYHQDITDKRYLEEFNKFIITSPPQFDKRFDYLLPYIEEGVKEKDELPYYFYLNRTPLKGWLLFLQAEVFKPNWYNNYKNTMIRNQKWIKSINQYPNKLTKLIKVLE